MTNTSLLTRFRQGLLVVRGRFIRIGLIAPLPVPPHERGELPVEQRGARRILLNHLLRHPPH